MTSIQLIDKFTKAYIILTASVLRADKLRQDANKIKRSNNVAVWIKNMNKKDSLLLLADKTESRGRKVWVNTTDFQGKYVNYCHLTEDNKSIFEIQLSITSIYNDILPTAKKLAY